METKLRNKYFLFGLILFFKQSDGQDSIYIYDISSQSIIQKPMPVYNTNAASDSTDPSFGVNGMTNLPSSIPASTYPSSNVSLIEKAADYYTSFNFPFTAVSLVRYGFNITSAIIGKRALLVFNFDVRQPHSHWRNLSDANPFYENGMIQYGFSKLTPVKYYTLNTPDTSGVSMAVVEVAENIGDDAGHFGLAFDTTANAYDSLLLYNISYPKKDVFNIYPDSTNGDTLYMKYGLVDGHDQKEFQAYFGGDGEYDSPFFDQYFRLRGIRLSVQTNYFISRKEFYFLKFIVDSLATDIDEFKSTEGWKIFPNPVSNKLTISFVQPLKSEATLFLTNVFGQTIKSIQLSVGSSNVDEDVSGLARGIYFVTVKSTENFIVEEFVKE